jgi:hypothetical protein
VTQARETRITCTATLEERLQNENSESEGKLNVCFETPFNSKHNLVAKICQNIMFHNNYFMFTIGRIVQHIWVDPGSISPC